MRVVSLLIVAAALGACAPPPSPTAPSVYPSSRAVPADPAPPGPTAAVPPATGEHAGAHILFAYVGATRARPEVTRTKAEAEQRAREVVSELRKDPSKFAELARLHSDCPSSQRGGVLGKWVVGRMVPEFDAALARMRFGEIVGPVETPFGFHVIRRDDPALDR